LSERFAEAPPAPDDPTAVEAMAHRLKTLEGRKLYAQRKHQGNRVKPIKSFLRTAVALWVMFARICTFVGE
jgi:hypothetical protein